MEVENQNISAFDASKIRNQFPILNQTIGKYPLVYLDNAATTQKPLSVIEKINDYYLRYNANIHRGAHFMANLGTAEYERSRRLIQQFIKAETPDQVIFTKGTTEGINLIASGLGKFWLKPGDEILISAMEHHANIVPWQMICEQTDATLKVIPILDSGELDLDAANKLFSDRTKVFSMVYVSNSLGTINPVHELVKSAQNVGAVTIVDCAQAVGHFPIDVQEIGADFIVFSGHKLFGPTGIGVLYGNREWLEKLPPYQGGGEMIKEVRFEKTTYNELPFKFEAGTPNIADGIGLGAAIEFLQNLDRKAIEEYEKGLLERTNSIFAEIPGIRFFGTAKHKASVVSFLINGTHPSDVGTLLDQFGIAVRTGHHCCQPLMNRFQIPGTVRVSLSFYNTFEEINFLGKSLLKVVKMLS